MKKTEIKEPAALSASMGLKSMGSNAAEEEVLKGGSLTKDAFRRLRKNKIAIIGLWAVGIYIILAITAPILPIYSFSDQVLSHQNIRPSLTKTAGSILVENRINTLMKREQVSDVTMLSRAAVDNYTAYQTTLLLEERSLGGKLVMVNNRRYILGTDDLGRDVLARVIYGSQISIAVGIFGAVTSVLIGTIIGAISGYVGGRTDYIIMRIVDVMYGLPYMLLVIMLMSIFGRNIINLFLALSLVSWLTTARVVRGQVMSLKNSLFVEAARSMGASNLRIVFVHLIPNTLTVIIIFVTLGVPAFILTESFLSFLGLGVSAPYTSWGALVRDAVPSMSVYPWRLLVPSIAMVIFLFSMNFIGDGFRDAFDPHDKKNL